MCFILKKSSQVQKKHPLCNFFQNEKNTLSVFGLSMRTTSPLESFNSVIGRSFPKHPNIFRFIDYMKMHESNIVLKMRSLLECDVPNVSQRKRDLERDAKITKATKMLGEKQIAVEEFLEIVSTDEMVPNKGLPDFIFYDIKSLIDKVYLYFKNY